MLLFCVADVSLTHDSQVGRVSNAGSRMSTDWMTPPRSLPPYNLRTSHTPTHPQIQPPDTYLPGEHSCRAMTLHQLQFPEILQIKSFQPQVLAVLFLIISLLKRLKGPSRQPQTPDVKCPDSPRHPLFFPRHSPTPTGRSAGDQILLQNMSQEFPQMFLCTLYNWMQKDMNN